MKDLFKHLFQGISLGLTFFVSISVLMDYINNGTFLLENWSFTKMAIGSAIVGIGFSVPSLIYKNSKLPYGLQIVIHMGIGCSIMLITAFCVGWIPTSLGIKGILISIVIEIISAFIIWFAFSLYYKQEATKINKQIDKLNL